MTSCRGDQATRHSECELNERQMAMSIQRLVQVVIVLTGVCGASATAAESVRLWNGDAPGALGQADHDIPTLTPYLPADDKASGTAIVVCPGGGYGGLAGHEGEGYAKWLADNG